MYSETVSQFICLLAAEKIVFAWLKLVIGLIQAGEINPAQLVVQFIDEEAIFPCMEEKVKEWRKKFMLVGAKFEWYCLEVKHYNCFHELSNDETFICWDRYKRDVWVRQSPSFISDL